MPNLLVAGNSTNGGTAISTDTSGTLNIVTGSGSGATAVTVDGSGNVVITGTLSASGGVSGGIRSGTAVTASGTSVDLTSLPTGLKRVTVMFSGISLSGAANYLIQLGAGSVTTTGYITRSTFFQGGTIGGGNVTNGFSVGGYAAGNSATGSIVFTLLTGNTWIGNGYFADSGSNATSLGGSIALSGTLDRVRITSSNGTDTFDAGSINIFYE